MGMDGIEMLMLDAPRMRETPMADDTLPIPDQNTQWVACAMANMAVRDLCAGLAARLMRLPEPPGHPEVGDEQRIRDLCDLAVDTVTSYGNLTDLDPDKFDLDIAKRVAIEMVEDASAEIRNAAGMR